MAFNISAYSVRAERGFFSTRSVRPSEIDGDDESSMLVHGPDSPGDGLETLSFARKSANSPRPIITMVWTWVFCGIVSTYVTFLPLVVLSLAVPIASFFALPILLFILVVLFYAIPVLSYLLLAQTAPPPHAPQPFRPQIRNVRQLFQINVAILRWARRAAVLVWTVGPEVFKTKMLYTISKSWSGRVKTNIPYGSTYASNKLDIYLPKLFPQTQSSSSGDNGFDALRSAPRSPIIIFVAAPQYGGVRSRKWMLASLGRNLARSGYCVVIPDIVAFGDETSVSTNIVSKPRAGSRAPKSRIRESVEDLRRVMLWAENNGGDFGGDDQKIFLAGHGLGAHLALLHTVQRAVVSTRENLYKSFSADSSGNAVKPPPVSISNGMRRVQEYGKEIPVPQIEGLILLSPICDVEKQVVMESEWGISHLSTVRRSLGPGQLPCIMHSPAHILHASRNVIDVDTLPRSVLFVHGGFDRVVNWSQSENMKEILRGVGVENVRTRVYATGHTGVLTALMGHTRETVLSSHISREVRNMVQVPQV